MCTYSIRCTLLSSLNKTLFQHAVCVLPTKLYIPSLNSLKIIRIINVFAKTSLNFLQFSKKKTLICDRMEAEFLFKSQFDRSLKLFLGGIIMAFSVQPLFYATVPKALLPPEPWVHNVPRSVVRYFKK